MHVDAGLIGDTIEELSANATACEQDGYTGLQSSEVARDPFLQLLLAAEHTTEIQLSTAIAVAFARTPMGLAYAARDLQDYSRGRFVLGLGSQVRAHIERRYSMPWSRPAARMCEFIVALRAIWNAWATEGRLDFRGDFYTHTLMMPFFTPPPTDLPPPPIHLAAVGPLMTKVAGEVADGLLVHPFTTRDYLMERTLPTLGQGLDRVGRSRGDVAVCVSTLVATGADERAMATAVDAVRGQIAFYGSTPAYRGVLEQHGWAQLGEQLTALARSDDERRWERMKHLVDDDVLHAVAVVAEPDRLGDALLGRYTGLADRMSFSMPYAHDRSLLQPAVETLRRAPAALEGGRA